MPKVVVSTKENYYLLSVDDMPSLQANAVDVSEEFYDRYQDLNKAYLMIEDELRYLYKEQYRTKGVL